MEVKSKKTIVIHSKVAYGYVGSNTTSLVLQLAGLDVIAVPTVILSNRFGLPTVGGGLIPADLFQEILDGILALNILDEVSTIVTGYIGSAALVEITAQFIVKIKESHPEIVYLCDPVMGDQPQGLYVKEEVPQALITKLLPLADILTPNQFEMETLLNQKIETFEKLRTSIQQHAVLHTKDILVTGCRFVTINDQLLHIIVKQQEQYEGIPIDYVPVDPPGTGELFAALVLVLKYRKYEDYKDCAKQASQLIQRVLRRMVKEGRSEFDLRDILAVSPCT
ncbi:pyridoxal kinase [Myroides sp. 1354]|uniref:pyridoxal kinase n=1 Tax=unclassified Myroides TaxID=2642485 RepID=UPI002575B653|nr:MULTISPECIES: pyridoxal kinase [unclassified Myroides]MDM1046204.1 pyridoxal kinase [Myroides sp. R163-1]MDM1057140.1 pyridoxal kinase [Myroides sp. 1354]MDM1070335.1 pyridoxal kinase [Myroides sp. 1372]